MAGGSSFPLPLPRTNRPAADDASIALGDCTALRSFPLPSRNIGTGDGVRSRMALPYRDSLSLPEVLEKFPLDGRSDVELRGLSAVVRSNLLRTIRQFNVLKRDATYQTHLNDLVNGDVAMWTLVGAHSLIPCQTAGSLTGT